MFRPWQVPYCFLKHRTLPLYRGIRSEAAQKRETETAAVLLSLQASRRMVPTHTHQLWGNLREFFGLYTQASDRTVTTQTDQILFRV